MSAFVTRCTAWLAVLLLFAVAAGLTAGALVFWGVLATGLAGWLGFHLYHIALLLRWLRAPRPECIPEGIGSWQQVFSALYRQARQQQLYATLAEAHGRYVTARLEVQRMQADVLPQLQKAERAAERAWRAIQANASYCVIPWQMAIVAKILRLLPNWAFDRIMHGKPRKPRKNAPPGG